MLTILHGVCSVSLWLVVLATLAMVRGSGHYAAACHLRIRTETFSFGFGPKVASHQDDRNTRWRLSLIPFGGYLSFVPNENPFDSKRHARRESLNRLTVMVAGPATNMLFSLLLFTILAMTLGKPANDRLVTSVEVGGLAQKAGLRIGDKLLSITRYWNSEEGPAESYVDYSILRKTRYLELDIPAPPPEVSPRLRTGGYESTRLDDHLKLRLDEALVYGLTNTWNAVKSPIVSVAAFARGERPSSDVLDDLAGIRLTAQHGLEAMLRLVAMTSASFATISLLVPVPLLDGGLWLSFNGGKANGLRSAGALRYGVGGATAILGTICLMTTMGELHHTGYLG